MHTLITKRKKYRTILFYPIPLYYPKLLFKLFFNS